MHESSLQKIALQNNCAVDILHVSGGNEAAGEGHDFHGLWRSQGGSLYVSDDDRFLCVAAHASACRGWLNKVAIKALHSAGGTCRGLQAFRNNASGELVAWEPITLTVSRNVLTKYFPRHLPRHMLTYGYIERYYRVRSPAWNGH